MHPGSLRPAFLETNQEVFFLLTFFVLADFLMSALVSSVFMYHQKHRNVVMA